ncbi:hypothetical protein EIP91_006749 [Steccherinum ochraceum]|uniref:F-box domain-containing protein n=1 Tax=Steccherinum ochraceum TaxID=92696 RepID=A0A4R0RJS2_9APHY|nr:hypothetical protein EIP91_006749 [Steccherinum ochraceum]
MAPKGSAHPHHGFIDFQSFLSDYPNLTKHVQELRLCGFGMNDVRWTSVCCHDVVNLLSQLPALRDLTFAWIRFNGCSSECSDRPPLPDPIRLRRLSFVPQNQSSLPSHAIEVLRLFGHIQRFIVQSFGIFQPDVSVAKDAHLRLQVQSLTISRYDVYDFSSSFLDIIRATPSMMSIATVVATCSTIAHFHSVARFLGELGPRLERLSLNVTRITHGDGDDTPDWTTPHLALCSQLQDLSMKMVLRGVPDPGEDLDVVDHPSEYTTRDSGGVMGILAATSRCHNIQRISVRVHFRSRYHLHNKELHKETLQKRVNWPKLRLLLGAYPALRRVTFDLVDGADDRLQQCLPVIQYELLALHQSGVLDVRLIQKEFASSNPAFEEEAWPEYA